MVSQSNNIPREKQEKLRKLLDGEGLDILIEVVESIAFEHECAAANKLMENTEGYIQSAVDSAQQAREAKSCIKIIKDLRERSGPFQTSISKPTPTSTPTTK